MEAVIFAELLDKSGAVRERQRYTQFPVRIGRGYGNDLLLDDEFVAPNHGLIFLREDGRLEYRDLGSENGSLLAGRPVKQHTLLADQTLLLGRSRLRLRTAACAVPPARQLHRRDERLLHWQPGWAATLITPALLIASVGVLTYLHQFSDPQPSRALAKSISALGALLLWAGLWAVLGRLFVQRSAYRAHLVVAAASLLLLEALDLLSDPLTPVLHVLPGADSLLTLLVLAPVLFGIVLELQLATHLQRRQAVVRVLGVCAALMVVGGVAEYTSSREFDPSPDVRTAVQALPNDLVPATTPAAFFKDAKDLRKQALDALKVE